MFAKLFGRSGAPGGKQARDARVVPPGERIYAIGDIHGRLDLLDDLLAQMEADDATRAPARTKWIFLGDLIDRGPESAQVVERLLRVQDQRAPGTTRFLLGNHEEVFLNVLSGDAKALGFFDRMGGDETIFSYGVPREDYREAEDAETVLAMVQAKVPRAHVNFLTRFEDVIVLGDYAFVHAGIRPGLPLAHQRGSDLRWIRREFLSFKGDLEKIIVHGHTIAPEVEEMRHRIGLDTGAYASGCLTAMGFEGDRRWILQTGEPAEA